MNPARRSHDTGRTVARFKHARNRDAVAAIIARYQPLRNDVAESFGKTLSYRLLFGGRERGDDAIHRLRGVDGVHAGKNEVAVFGGVEKNLERLPVADFAHHNHSRRLSAPPAAPS